MFDNLINLVHLGAHAFEEIVGEKVQTCSYVIRNNTIENYIMSFVKALGGENEKRKEEIFLSRTKMYYKVAGDIKTIQGYPFTSYWASHSVLEAFKNGEVVGSCAEPRVGMATANNDRFIRNWHEVFIQNVGFGMKSRDIAINSKRKWFPFAKGGEYRKWYGNNDTVVNWENDGFEIRNFKDENTGRIRSHNYNLDYIFQSALTWTVIGTEKTSFRYCPVGFLYSNSGYGMFCNDCLKYFLLGLMNSSITESLLQILSPSMGFESGYLRKLPIVKDVRFTIIDDITKSNVNISKLDWDSFETSWDFQKHPLLPKLVLGSEAVFIDEEKKLGSVSVSAIKLQDEYERVKEAWEKNFLQLKANEEELNRIFIDIYGLQDELTPDVEDKDVTVHRIYDSKEDVPESMKGSNYVLTKQDVVKSLISYAVGCMFGRYSLDKEGLVYAGGDWDDSNYVAFPADKDAIIPICDDEYFNDDIVARFVEFIKVVYGEDTLEENLIFIAEALGGNGSARDVIRAYFINGFYSDHCKTYQKRPIYWLFDSGKKNGFKCLIYMHRYHKDTVARVRTDYLHEQQSRYRTNIEDLKNRINNATSTGMRVKLEKQLVALEAQAAEAFAYEEKMKHIADQMLEIDLDDGVKHNYAIFQDVLAKIK